MTHASYQWRCNRLVCEPRSCTALALTTKGTRTPLPRRLLSALLPDAESKFFEHPHGVGLATLEVCGAELLARWIRSRVKVGSLHHAALLGTDNPYDILLQ